MTRRSQEMDRPQNETTLHEETKHKKSKKWLNSLINGALSCRRMVRKEDLLKVFFVYLCLWHVTPGHPCGSNPLRRFRNLSHMLGQDMTQLLSILRRENPEAYTRIQSEWRIYADCVGLVDTGYFKRSGRQASGADQAGQRMADREARRSSRMTTVLHALLMLPRLTADGHRSVDDNQFEQRPQEQEL